MGICGESSVVQKLGSPQAFGGKDVRLTQLKIAHPNCPVFHMLLSVLPDIHVGEKLDYKSFYTDFSRNEISMNCSFWWYLSSQTTHLCPLVSVAVTFEVSLCRCKQWVSSLRFLE